MVRCGTLGHVAALCDVEASAARRALRLGDGHGSSGEALTVSRGCAICDDEDEPRADGAPVVEAPLYEGVCERCWLDSVPDVHSADQVATVIVRGPDVLAAPSTRRGLVTEPTITPEQTLRDAGIDDARQAAYQRRLSALLAGRPS